MDLAERWFLAHGAEQGKLSDLAATARTRAQRYPRPINRLGTFNLWSTNLLTPLLALALFRIRVRLVTWLGVVLAAVGLAMLTGIHAGSAAGDLLVLAGAAVYSVQIVLMERYAPLYDALAFTLVEMLTAFVGLGVFAIPELEVPRGWTVWGALLVTGIFASALGFLVQTWAQQTTSATRTALLFTLEPVWAALFGYTLAGDRLGALGWGGCAVIMGGIVLAEPAAAAVLARLVRRPRPV